MPLDDLIVETGEPGSDECQPGQDAAHDNRYRGCDRRCRLRARAQQHHDQRQHGDRYADQAAEPRRPGTQPLSVAETETDPSERSEPENCG